MSHDGNVPATEGRSNSMGPNGRAMGTAPLDVPPAGVALAGCTRRTFTTATLAAVVHALALPVLAACADQETPSISGPVPPVSYRIEGALVIVDLANSPALARAAAFILADAGVLLVREGDAYRAFSNVCTHAGCGITEVLAAGVRCRCHGSEFSLAGQVRQGPALTPLTPFSCVQTGARLVITRR